MKYLLTFFTLVLSPLCQAQDQAPEPLEKQELILQNLFNSREPIEFAKAVIEAKKHNVSEQVILEATFLYHVDKNEYASIVELTKQFQAMTAKFDPKVSKIFAHKEDWLSVIEYGLALQALEKNDLTTFQKHIKEAFWLSPNKASAFAHHITKIHTQAAMKNVKLDLNRKIFQVDKNEPTSLKKLLGNKQAIVLRFWSPWNQNINNTYPQIVHLSQQSNIHKISFASILINRDPQGIKDTKEVIKETGNDLTSHWLADENNGHLTKLLRIDQLPTIVVINKSGEILFNGPVTDQELWKTLQKIAPNLAAPKNN